MTKLILSGSYAPHSNEKDTRGGFTLVEVVVSALILLIATAGMYASFLAAQKYVANAKRRLAAVNFAQQRLEELKPYVRQDTWANGTTGVNLLYAPQGIIRSYNNLGDPGFQFGGNMRYTVTNSANTAYRAVAFTASWNETN